MWFTSKENATKAVEDFQACTLTKFILEYHHVYGVNENNKRIRWNVDTGIPYVITDSTRLECQHSKDRNVIKKKKQAEKNPDKKKYCCVQTTKKKNCGAKISLLEIMQFPQFQLTMPMSYQHRIYSRKIHLALRTNNADLVSVYMCRVLFPEPGSHTGHSVQQIQCKVVTQTQKYLLGPNMSGALGSSSVSQNLGGYAEGLTEILLQIQNVSATVTSPEALIRAKFQLNAVLQQLTQSSNVDLDENHINYEGLNNAGPHKRRIEDITFVPISCKLSRTSSNLESNIEVDNTASYVVEVMDADLTRHHVSSKVEEKFTPDILAFKGVSLSKVFLKNGPHSVSLLRVLSLEPKLREEERQLLCSQDESFQEDCIYDEVVDSFMSCISQINSTILYASSHSARLMCDGNLLAQLWEDKTLVDKRYLFIPWHPNDLHWILLAVDLEKHCLYYLDPLQDEITNINQFVKSAQNFVASVLREKFGFCLESLEFPDKTVLSDKKNSGAYICMYAYWLTNGENLTKEISDYECRKHVYDVISGHCLEDVRCEDKSICKVCNLSGSLEVDGYWIECTRCEQWFHFDCIGLSLAQAEADVSFVCPQLPLKHLE